jgi:putative endonuclease
MNESSKLTVYVLRSIGAPTRHFVGVTRDLPKRLDWHNRGQNATTARERPWSVIVALEFDDAQTAIRFERYLKTGSGRAFAKRHFA